MNRYWAYSSGFHLLAALLLVVLLAPSAAKKEATYTIDFIGSGKVVAVTGQEAKPAAAPQPAPKQTEVAAAPAKAEPAPAAKPATKEYAAKAEISAKKQPKKKAKAPAKPAAPLAAPSVLDEPSQTPSEGAASSQEGEFQGGSIQTDFADFPHPWYITKVRNALWIEWEKRRPAGNTLRATVTFAIARNGQIKRLQVEKSSGDDTFDFAATSAVINAGPFAPLPMLYEKDELTVTLEYKQEK